MAKRKFKNSIKERLSFSKEKHVPKDSIISKSNNSNASELLELSKHLQESQEEKNKLSDKIASLEKAQGIIFDQFKNLEIQRAELEDQQKKLEDASDKFRTRTIELFGKMIDLKKAKKTISQQNEKLEHQQKEIEKHQVLLEKSSEKFRDRTIELFGKMIDLKKAKKTISHQKEEIEIHREKLKELNANKDKFFSIIAHDLRNPIAGFLNLTEILSTNFEVLTETERKDFVEVMNQASKQLYNLLENLLQWSRAQTGNLTYEPKFVSVKQMVDNSIDSLMLNIENKKLNVVININENEKVFADENMITTVIRNLLSNAIKFSNKEQSIQIRCSLNENNAEIAIVDQGIGIKPEIKEKLFKIDNHITTQGTLDEKGSGLGLILCKEFIEKNGGKIWAESEPNKGSAFMFLIPLYNKN